LKICADGEKINLELKQSNIRLTEQLRHSREKISEKDGDVVLQEKLNTCLEEQKAKLLQQLGDSTQTIVNKDKDIAILHSQIGKPRVKNKELQFYKKQ